LVYGGPTGGFDELEGRLDSSIVLKLRDCMQPPDCRILSTGVKAI